MNCFNNKINIYLSFQKIVFILVENSLKRVKKSNNNEFQKVYIEINFNNQLLFLQT